MNRSREVLFVGGYSDRWWVGTEDFVEVTFGLDEGVGVGAVDDEDDAIGAAGEGFADEAELLEAGAAEKVSFEFAIFEGAKVEANGTAVDFSGDSMVGDPLDECGFADTLGSNDQDFQMPHAATP
jgi:hypothetical protein